MQLTEATAPDVNARTHTSPPSLEFPYCVMTGGPTATPYSRSNSASQCQSASYQPELY